MYNEWNWAVELVEWVVKWQFNEWNGQYNELSG